MLTIRQEQLRILADGEVERFEAWMVGHLKRFFPYHCRSHRGRLHEFVRYGMERAANYGFTSRRDICKYIDLMMTFGRDFDRDARLPWASAILAKQREPQGKMALLFHMAVDHLR